MAWFIGQSAIVILAAFLLGVLVGWLVRGRRVAPSETEPSETVPSVVEASVVAPSVVPASEAVPEVVAASETVPEVVAAEDLERVEGVGPKMADALLQAGIRTYAQLAAADEAALRQAIEAAGLKFAPSLVTWSKQAQLLADGDEEGFEELTRRLVAGRETVSV